MFKKVEPRVKLPELEAEVLARWNKEKTFEKSVENRKEAKTFSFYDGPPFATGTPHYGHILAGTIKDVIPRYKTMQGYRVERIWGWDTHGLPIENIVEQELSFSSKDQVAEYGIDKFNEKCRTKVLKYAEEWKRVVARTGRWVDMENAYLTMSPQFMESVWWVFAELYKKDLAYPGHKVMPYCPRCATPLSNFEVGQGYKDKNDMAVTVRFQAEDDPGTYFLAWTTTPWTLPGNLALAVGEKINYVTVENKGKHYILAEERLDHYREVIGDKVIGKIKGKELVGRKYVPIMDCYQNPKKAFEVVAGDHVTTEDGTGIVHTAPAFGEEDQLVAKKAGLDFFMPVDDLGHFTVEVPDYAGQSVIEKDTNEKIIAGLGDKAVLVEDITHSYPHCWRCETPLIYRGVASWFVAVEKVKQDMLAVNKKIYWLPDKVGHGRFANLIENAPDWSISRNRFWGTPLPVWKCADCGKVEVLASIKELEEKSGEKNISDIHLHKIKDIKFDCDCGGKYELSGEVFDCWFESGSMPYGSIHYPTENKEKFERDFPADFIAEGIDQTRGWFYSLLVLAVSLFGKSAYDSVVVNGTVLAEDGQKMSKRLKNYPDPIYLVDRYGADAVRFFLMSSPATKAEDLRFSEKGVDEIVKKMILTLWNSYSFFVTYANLDNFTPTGKLDSKNVLDQWMITKTKELVTEVTASMEKYELAAASRHLAAFVDDLSNWYIRRSRKRFWKSENDSDKTGAYETLYYALTAYLKLLAPFMPFVTDEIYRNLTGESVHLSDWPQNPKVTDSPILEEMELVRKLVEAGLSARNEAQIKVRQPLAKLSATVTKADLSDALLAIVAEEVNVKEVVLKKGKELKVTLDTKITPELRAEGVARDLVRHIQEARKKADFNVEDRIVTIWEVNDGELVKIITSQADYVSKETLSSEFKEGEPVGEYQATVKLDGQDLKLGLRRVK